MRELVINGQRIAENAPAYCVVDASHNAGGDIVKAVDQIIAAKAAGASAVKFQTRSPKDVYQMRNVRGGYLFESENPQWMDRVYGIHREKLEFSPNEWDVIKNACDFQNTTFLSTPFDFRSADLLVRLNVPAFKIASGDATNTPLIKYVAATGKPVIVSTGGCTLDDVKRVYNTVDHSQLALLQCSCVYPAPPEALNLRVIETYLREFPDVVIGLSTHSSEWQTSVAAYVLGARIFEHHFTLDRTWKGTDNAFSLTPPMLREFVDALETVRKALGGPKKVCTPIEKEPTKERRKSLVWARQVMEWGRITRDDIKILCPGDGIAPYYLDAVVGQYVSHSVGKDELVQWHDLMTRDDAALQEAIDHA